MPALWWQQQKFLEKWEQFRRCFSLCRWNGSSLINEIDNGGGDAGETFTRTRRVGSRIFTTSFFLGWRNKRGNTLINGIIQRPARQKNKKKKGRHSRPSCFAWRKHLSIGMRFSWNKDIAQHDTISAQLNIAADIQIQHTSALPFQLSLPARELLPLQVCGFRMHVVILPDLLAIEVIHHIKIMEQKRETFASNEIGY